MSMPAIVVNEKVVSMGKVLKAADVEKLLRKLGYWFIGRMDYPRQLTAYRKGKTGA